MLFSTKSLLVSAAIVLLSTTGTEARRRRPRSSTISDIAQPTQSPSKCPGDVLSCSSGSDQFDTCCVPKYGLLVLTQQWFNGLGPKDEFTLHGLWPDTCTGGQTGDSGCDSARSYDNVGSIIQGADSKLYDQLNTYWPSYKGDNNAFWSHEWTKHGTCVTTLAPTCYPNYKKNQEVVEYFGTVLQLRSKYNYYKALAKRGIVPTAGKKFTAKQFKDAIKAELGVDVAIKCKSGTLSEIWAWFNVKNKVNYIPTHTYASDTCTSFTYPPK